MTPISLSKEMLSLKLAEIWQVLTPEQQNYLYDQALVQRYAKGEMLYEEGQSAEYLMAVLTGCVKIYKEGHKTRIQILRLVIPGQYFGYRARFVEESYVTSASCLKPTEICLVPMVCIERLVNQNLSLAKLFIRLLSRDLGVCDSRSISLTQSHIRGRLAETLIFLAYAYGTCPDNITLSVELSREDLAALSNMTTANAIRTLSSFQSEGLISIHGRAIRLNDAPKLRLLAQNG